METNITLGNYFSSEHNDCDDIDEYTWFYKLRYFFDPCTKKIKLGYDNDKIGISSNGKYMTHDDIMWELIFFKKYEDVEGDGKRYLYLIYKINKGIDLIMRRDDTLLYFKYEKQPNGKTNFMSIGFNNAEFRSINRA